MNKSNNISKLYICTFIVIAGLIGIVVYLKSSSILNIITSAEELRKYIEGFGSKAYVMFFVIQILSVIIAPIPSNISAVVGGSIFGMWYSFFISILAIIIGSIIVFILGRILGRTFAERFIKPELLSRYEQYFISGKGEVILILLLILPFFPDDVINLVAGLSKISLKRYVIMMLLTRPWEILAASAFGSSNIAIPLWAWGIIAIVIIYIAKNSNRLEAKLVAAMKAV